MRARAVMVLVLGVLAAACTGGEPAAGGSSAAPSPSGSRSAAAVRASVSARLMVGVASADGVVTRSCTGKDCKTAPVEPARYLDAVDSGLMLFALSSRPQRVSVAVHNASGAVVASAQPRVETNSIAWAAPALPKGRYRVVLTGTWRGSEVGWVFGLRVGRTPKP